MLPSQFSPAARFAGLSARGERRKRLAELTGGELLLHLKELDGRYKGAGHRERAQLATELYDAVDIFIMKLGAVHVGPNERYLFNGMKAIEELHYPLPSELEEKYIRMLARKFL